MPNDLDNLEAKIAQFKSGKAAESQQQSNKQKDAENVNTGIRAG